jgi:hypothetical protein
VNSRCDPGFRGRRWEVADGFVGEAVFVGRDRQTRLSPSPLSRHSPAASSGVRSAKLHPRWHRLSLTKLQSDRESCERARVKIPALHGPSTFPAAIAPRPLAAALAPATVPLGLVRGRHAYACSRSDRHGPSAESRTYRQPRSGCCRALLASPGILVSRGPPEAPLRLPQVSLSYRNKRIFWQSAKSGSRRMNQGYA